MLKNITAVLGGGLIMIVIFVLFAIMVLVPVLVLDLPWWSAVIIFSLIDFILPKPINNYALLALHIWATIASWGDILDWKLIALYIMMIGHIIWMVFSLVDMVKEKKQRKQEEELYNSYVNYLNERQEQ